MKTNIHETLARAAKVEALLGAIQREVVVDKHTAGPLAKILEGWTDKEWLALAASARCHPPSAISRAHVIEAVRALGTPNEDTGFCETCDAEVPMRTIETVRGDNGEDRWLCETCREDFFDKRSEGHF